MLIKIIGLLLFHPFSELFYIENLGFAFSNGRQYNHYIEVAQSDGDPGCIGCIVLGIILKVLSLTSVKYYH